MGCAEAVKALSNLNCVSMMWLGMNGVCRGCESAFKVKLTEQDVVWYEWGVQRL